MTWPFGRWRSYFLISLGVSTMTPWWRSCFTLVMFLFELLLIHSLQLFSLFLLVALIRLFSWWFAILSWGGTNLLLTMSRLFHWTWFGGGWALLLSCFYLFHKVWSVIASSCVWSLTKVVTFHHWVLMISATATAMIITSTSIVFPLFIFNSM